MRDEDPEKSESGTQSGVGGIKVVIKQIELRGSNGMNRVDLVNSGEYA